MPAVPFIPGEIDDLGLTPQEFRVLGHVARRAGQNSVCYAGVATMAKTCRIHPDTIRKALKFLVGRGLIFARMRQGRTTEYFFHPPEKKGGVANTPRKPKEENPPKPRENHPPESKGDKGIPIKGSPLKAFPLNENENALSAAFEKMRAEIRKPVPPDSRSPVDFNAEIRERLERIIPDWRKHHFSLLYRQNPQKFERVLADVECQVREGKKLRNPGGYFTDTWQRFK